jgi:hypothetical protein
MIGSPFDLDDGKVWSDPCDYNRPWLPELFNPLVEGLDTTSSQSSPKIMNSQAAGIKSWPARLKEKAGISNVSGHLRDEHMLEICKVFKGLIEEERVKNA